MVAKKNIQIFIISSLFLITRVGYAMGQSVEIESLLADYVTVSEAQKPRVLLKLGIEYSYSDSFALGLKYLTQALHEAERFRQTGLVVEANYYLGDLYLQFDDLNNAQKYFFKAFQLSEKYKIDKMLVFCSAGLGSVYIETNDWDLAKDYLEKALLIAEKNHYEKEIPKLLNLMGIVYSKSSKLDSALYNFEKLLKFGVERNDSQLIGFAYINTADVKMKTGRYDDAISLFKKALQITVLKKDIKTYAIIHANLGESYLRQHQYKIALEYLTKSNTIAERQGYLSIMMTNYKNISEVYKASRDFELSLVNLELFTLFKDSILDDEKQRQLQNLKIKNQQEQTERKFSELEQKTKIRNLLFIFALVISILFVVILVQRYRRIQLTIKVQEMEKSRMVTMIDRQNRDLVALSMNLSQKKQLISKVKDSIRGISKSSGKTARVVLNEIKSKFVSDTYIDGIWESFLKHFSDLNPVFFKDVQAKHPNLTKSDMKHCAYVKLNLSNKDVAVLNNVNPSSVQMARYRLKKKLKLKNDEDLSEYLSKFG
jgi:tetratricopeptide (TPR) repeat protein/DNA-binding CsgD family transcriptional regulator